MKNVKNQIGLCIMMIIASSTMAQEMKGELRHPKKVQTTPTKRAVLSDKRKPSNKIQIQPQKEYILTKNSMIKKEA